MIQFISFILATIGVSYIITQSDFFKPLRDKINILYNNKPTKVNWFISKCLTCIKCFSFWGGIFCYLLVYYMKLYFVIFALISVGVIYLITEIRK